MPDWIAPWRSSEQTLCPGCSTLVLAATTTRGHCRECAERLGVERAATAATDPQMSLSFDGP